MTKICILIVAINIMPVPAVASNCISSADIAASRARWATQRSQSASDTDSERVCRAYAASFYESVTVRHVATICIRSNDRQQDISVLDSEINAFNNALASKCGG